MGDNTALEIDRACVRVARGSAHWASVNDPWERDRWNPVGQSINPIRDHEVLGTLETGRRRGSLHARYPDSVACFTHPNPGLAVTVSALAAPLDLSETGMLPRYLVRVTLLLRIAAST